MKHHDLKIWPVPFAEVRAGRKTFEIRNNDRDYQSGDTVTLHEWDPLTHTYTGKREGPFTVGTVIPAGEWGFPENLCVFSLLRPSPVVMPEGVREAMAVFVEGHYNSARHGERATFDAGLLLASVLRSMARGEGEA